MHIIDNVHTNCIIMLGIVNMLAYAGLFYVAVGSGVIIEDCVSKVL